MAREFKLEHTRSSDQGYPVPVTEKGQILDFTK